MKALVYQTVLVVTTLSLYSYSKASFHDQTGRYVHDHSGDYVADHSGRYLSGPKGRYIRKSDLESSSFSSNRLIRQELRNYLPPQDTKAPHYSGGSGGIAGDVKPPRQMNNPPDPNLVSPGEKQPRHRSILPTDRRRSITAGGSYIWKLDRTGSHSVEVIGPYHQYSVHFVR